MDARVIIRETVLDNFLSAVGPIGNTEKFSVAGIKGNYTWSIQNPRIEISTDKARFITDASVKVMSFTYDTTAYGDVEVKYDPAANRISVKILKAAVLIYANLFGRKFNITEIDISRFYKMQFEFAGPQPVQTKADVTLPEWKNTHCVRDHFPADAPGTPSDRCRKLFTV